MSVTFLRVTVTPKGFQPSSSPLACRKKDLTIMKVLVGIKRVVDYAVKVRVNQGTVELKNVKQSMNPFCEVSESVLSDIYYDTQKI